MRSVVGVVGIALLAIVLWDAFETIILPRRISGRFRLAKLFYRATWPPWRAVAPLLPRRPGDAFLSFYGPLSLILLLALWAVRDRTRVRHAAMGRRLGAHHDRRRPRIRGRHVHERHDVLYARPGRRRAPYADREDARRRRSRNGFRVLGARDRLLPRDLSGVLAPRDGDLAARCARRIAADGGRAAVALPLGQERRGARRAVTGVGALGRRRAREPSVLSGARLLPIAALQPILA